MNQQHQNPDIIKTAVIMAAGMGVRFGRVGELMPKGFISVDNTPIVEKSVQRLIASGIDHIIIITGHLREYYENLQALYPDIIQLAHNDKFETSGSMYSLYCARDLINSSFLLLEADIVYEQRAISALLTQGEADIILCSGESGSDDAVFIATENGQLTSMSKDSSQLGDSIFGELVGICKISMPLFQHMIVDTEQAIKHTLQIAYETDCLVSVAHHYSVLCHKVEDLIWCEIDNDEHLIRARNDVYPRLKKNERSLGGRFSQALKTIQQRMRSLRKSFRKPPTMSGANYRLGKKMLLDVTEVFNQADIRYMVDQGTLIGIARDGDLLPWDDDVDIALPQDQVALVEQLLPTLRARGWRVSKRFMHYTFHCWRKGDLQSYKIRKMRWGFLRSRIRMDINIKYRHNDKYFWHSMGMACEVDAKHFDQTEKMEFAGQNIMVPAFFAQYLEGKYGDWKTPDRDYVPRHKDGTTIGKIVHGRTLR